MATNKQQTTMRLIRHATVVIETGGITLLIDPLLSKKDTLDPVRWSNEIRNPTIELPISDTELENIIQKTDAVLVTHLHRDHWDVKAQELIPKDKFIICQPEDEEALRQQGFTNLHSDLENRFKGLQINRVKAQHGHGELIEKMAPASGYMIKATGKTIYVAGDTVWDTIVLENMNKYQPDYIIVNAGAAQFNFGEPITMTSADVIQSAKNSKAAAKIIAVHMEAINHCRLKREEIRSAIKENGLTEKIAVPNDGETIVLG